jgi:tetratricopeptide (TPR) repeat protein
LGVFEQVCQAMAYAHARGVVHRDLKPANVMVGTFGEVQVMDWGFAKVLGGDAGPAPEAGAADTVFVAGPDGVTKSGTLMGTPAYMPPEQARGQAGRIDARADVFALGAILCEILTGRPPYTGTTDEICAKAAEGDLAGAHARLDACGADAALRDLAKCCLVAERAARPTDAGAVARDVSAYLASAQERLRQAQLEQTAAEARAKAQAERRARRLTLALAAALLCGTAVAVWQAVVATRAEQSARAAAAAETTAKQTAQAKEEETQAVLAFVQDRILAAARPEGQDGGLGHGVTLRQALEAALPHVDRSFASQPLTEARLRMALADSFFYLGDAKTAAAQNERVRALCLEHLGPDHPNTIGCLTNLANNYEALGRQDEAVRLREAALPLLRGRLGDDHPDTLKCMSNLAVSYTALGMYEEALRLDEQTLALRRKTLGPDHPDTLESMNNVAADHADLGQYAESAQLHEQTLSLRLDKLGENHPDTLTSMANLAACYVDLRRPGDALPLCERALAGRRAKLGDKHPDTLTSMTNLASCHDALGQRDEALKLAEEAVALLVAKHGPDHPDTLGGQYNLAWYYGRVGRHPEALQLHEATLARRKAQLGDDHPDTLTSMGGVAVSLVELHRGAEAVLIIDDCVRRAAGRAVNPKLIPGVLDLRLRHFEKAKDAAGCRATAALWEKLQRTDADSLYNAACFRAVTAAVLRAADTPSANEADAEAERAMAWLTKAVAAGYKNVASLTKDTDLDALRDRADFKALVAEIAGR